MSTIYDVTTWVIPGNPGQTAANDIGAMINSIIADIKIKQPTQASKPGAVIYIPPGDYSLKTRVVVDLSYLQIKGSGHGFTSSSIRYNSGSTASWFEIWPGGSRIKVENTDGHQEAFLVTRGGNPRLSGIEFYNFCLDGVSFTPNQNSYVNTRKGIRIATANDAVRIEGMGFVYLSEAISVHDADALSITNNFIAECGNCIKLTGSGQASMVTNNLIGAGYVGFSIYAESHFGLLVTGNNIFPRGASMVHLKNCTQSIVSSNRMHAFYPGMIVLEGACVSNLISSNHLLRQRESWGPMQGYNNGRDDLYGLIQINGSTNTVTGNHISYDVAAANVTPLGATPSIVLVKSGTNNYIATNHTVASVGVKTVVLDGSTVNSKVMDNGTLGELQAFAGATYGFRATP